MKKAILLTATVLLCALFGSADLAQAQSCGHIEACSGRSGAVPDGTGAGVPLTVAHSAIPGDLDLSWGASCVSIDSDYAVYEGVLGDFTSHVPAGFPALCSTGGATTQTFTPAAGDRYYLVVPQEPSQIIEGSYGVASDGAPRAQSLFACATQAVCDCPMIAFLTSAPYDGNLGGLAGADANCQGLADAAGLAGSYKAWLSDSTTAALDRLTQSTLPYVRTDGQVIADDWADLIDNPNLDPLLNPINRDEHGNALGGTNVWTATNFAGGRTGADKCSDWLDGTNAGDARTGNKNEVGIAWTSTATRTCDSTLPLYCFEQCPKTVFVTSEVYDGNLGGLAGADAKCQSLADAAGLVGTYKAWLSDGTTTADARLTQSTIPYVRTDGRVIADDWADLIDDPSSDPLLVRINRDENGNEVAGLVWTGSNFAGGGTGPDKCSDWLDGTNGGNARVGNTDRVNIAWTSSGFRTCDLTLALYCFEQ